MTNEIALHRLTCKECRELGETKTIRCYTAEPIYSYMIGKDARHNQVSISKNDHPQISPRKPGLDHNDTGQCCKFLLQ